ncbi:MAG: efflux RND transporter periplasmic adaptor subunit [Acidobacteria bacterium]|nr:efflux RND transporter periplasmic adaptor subunit [Acidobacteriota bacterium]
MKTITAFVCILLLAACAGQKEEPAPKPVVEVKVARAEFADVQLSVQAPATLHPREQASIASKITAPIRTLFVKKGDAVSAGQVLARLENRDLVAQRVEALDRARAEAAATEAALAQARKNLDRRQKLFDEGAIPSRELLASQTEYAQAKANYDVAHKYLDLLLSAGQRAETTGGEKASTAFLNAQLEFTEIRSPFAGVVTEQFMYPGDMAKPESPIFTVMDLSVAVARAQVPDAEIAGVARGQACAFESADSPGSRSSGRVSVVNQAVDPARRTVEVWCEIANPRRALRAGVFGTLTLLTGSAPKSVVVPKEAVQFVEGTTKGTVWVAGADKHVTRREVETGGLFKGSVRILRGLKAGETVVIEGGYGLPDGTEVRWTEEKKP